MVSNPLIRSAAAFGIKEGFVVGAKKLQLFGSQGSHRFIRMHEFESLVRLKEYLINKNISVCGVEITDTAVDVAEMPFKGPTAFIFGNEGTGLSDKQKAICDHYVYIPQYSGAIESLNVAVAAGIVLHYFASKSNCCCYKYLSRVVRPHRAS